MKSEIIIKLNDEMFENQSYEFFQCGALFKAALAYYWYIYNECSMPYAYLYTSTKMDRAEIQQSIDQWERSLTLVHVEEEGVSLTRKADTIENIVWCVKTVLYPIQSARDFLSMLNRVGYMQDSIYQHVHSITDVTENQIDFYRFLLKERVGKQKAEELIEDCYRNTGKYQREDDDDWLPYFQEEAKYILKIHRGLLYKGFLDDEDIPMLMGCDNLVDWDPSFTEDQMFDRIIEAAEYHRLSALGNTPSEDISIG